MYVCGDDSKQIPSTACLRPALSHPPSVHLFGHRHSSSYTPSILCLRRLLIRLVLENVLWVRLKTFELVLLALVFSLRVIYLQEMHQYLSNKGDRLKV